jgi:hypothetical protein
MKTIFNEKLNIRKRDTDFEIEIENLVLLSCKCKFEMDDKIITKDSYSVYLNRRSAKLLCKKLQNLIKNGHDQKLIK